MRRLFQRDLNATVTLDDAGRIRAIKYVGELPDISDLSGRAAAEHFVRTISATLSIPTEQLRGLRQRVSYLDPQERGVEFHLSDEKTFFESTTYSFYQTYLNIPVWQSGITVTIKRDPARVTGATNTSHGDIDAALPAARDIVRFRELFATGGEPSGGEAGPKVARSKASDERAAQLLAEILGEAAPNVGKDAPESEVVQVGRGRFFVYRYDPDKRTDDFPRYPRDKKGQSGGLTDVDQPEPGRMPELPLAPVPKSIQPGGWYVVAELILRLPERGRSLIWRLLVEVETNAILYARALTAGVNGLVFRTDPISASGVGTNSPDAAAGTLNPLRRSVELLGLAPPAPNQALTGEFIQVSDFELATAAPPTETAGSDFDYDTRTNDFAAVNAYYHCDRFFRLVEDLGYDIPTYFDGTSFPIPVDHRGRFGSADGIERNASCSPNMSADGIGNVDFELADLTDTANPMGIAADWRVVLHELGGHGILYDHVGTANFGFAHSAGDSFAVILNDPEGQAPDRFESFPWVSFIGRRHDRTVAAGWGWGGPQDVGGYPSESILATCLHLIYRSIGGDSDRLTRRQFAARNMAWLMLRAVGTLTPMSNPSSPAQFLDALLTADEDDWTSEGIFGGAYGKVMVWSFERQNLNDGDPPNVDVYVDDGRAGEYEFLSDYSHTATIWNRHAPDGVDAHQEPNVGTNYAYVKIRNRGTSVAENVAVRAFHCKPSAGLVWPGDLQPMTTAELPSATVQPNNAEEVIVGPFEWTPVPNAEGHDSMFMIVSATGDPSNADKFSSVENIDDWRLVPNDNNIGLRDVRLLPRLVTVLPDNGAFGNVCVGLHKDLPLTLSNSGFNHLSVTSIVSSSPPDFIVPGVVSYPIVIGSGDSIAVPIRFQPGSFAPTAATITVFSNDAGSPRVLRVSGEAAPPRLVTIIADRGNFGDVCRGSFSDKMLILSNSERCPLTVSAIASSSSEFVVGDVLSYPLVIGAGDSVHVPVRFEPGSFGSKSALITITSDDPTGNKIVRVSGNAPSGKLAVTGTTCIGGVKACCVGERTISICNTGACALHVSSVGFSRKSKHWKLVNNPFPATLHPGACLAVLIRYKATEKCPRCQELVIKSDDPSTPVKTLDLLAYTVWSHSHHGKDCDECDEGACECHCGEGCTHQSMDACCFDEECDEEGHD